MKKTFVILFFASAILIAGLHVQAQIGDVYTIKKGDTLWDISEAELEDYFLWPKLWSVNPHIENPDLIYPGEQIRIPTREELMRMTAPPKKMPMTARQKEEEVEPGHVFKHRDLIKKKYLVDRELFVSSGWIDPTFPAVGEVVAGDMGRTMTGRDDIAFVKINKGYESADKFFVIKDVKMVHHPESGELMGHQIRVVGVVHVTGKKNGIYETVVTTSFEDIEVGYGLFPFTTIEPPLITQDSRTPSFDGHIVASHTDATISGEGDIIFIDKGEDNGIMVGDIFSVISEPPIEQVLGKVQVVALKPTTASAIVIESKHEISLGAKYGQQ